MIKKIILDTNFLLIPMQFKVDIFLEIDKICLFKYKLFVLDKTIDELDSIIKKQKGKHKLAAKIALQLIKKKDISKIKTKEGRVDDILLNQDAIIATQDRALIKRLKDNKKEVIQLKQKKYLMLKQ